MHMRTREERAAPPMLHPADVTGRILLRLDSASPTAMVARDYIVPAQYHNSV